MRTISLGSRSYYPSETLLAWPQARRLTSLSLGATGVHSAQLALLGSSDALAGLVHLDLDGNPLDDTAARALAGATHFRQLRQLSLNHGKIGPEGAFALAAAPWLPGLEVLKLWGNPVRDEGAEALAEALAGGRLRLLLLRAWWLSDACQERLRARLGERVCLAPGWKMP